MITLLYCGLFVGGWLAVGVGAAINVIRNYD
jgi:hypothetical protein